MGTNKKISELDHTSSVNGNEDVEILQGGDNKRALLSVIADYVKTVVGNIFDSIVLNKDYTPISTEEGEIFWNGKYYTPEYDTGLGVTIRDGDTEYWVFYNDTGGTIPAGKVMHLLSGFTLDGEIYPTFEYADGSDWQKVQGTLAMSMHSVSNASLGILAKSSQKISADTSGLTAASQIWVSTDGSGNPTSTKPQYPNIAISIGASYDSAADGCLFFNQTTDIESLFDDAWDGAVLETFDFTVSSDGATVTGSLENSDNTRDLPIKFSDNFYTFDTTPAATVTLTPGTDTAPTTNYVYIPKSTKVLTVSTTGFPVTEHAKIAQLVIQSATTVQTESGAVRNQNINDHIKTTDDNGHILHIAERIRQLNAQWDNGTEATLTGTTTNGYIQVTSGHVWQMHLQSVNSFSMPTSNIQIVNDNTTAYRRTNNLNTITAYSDGSSWNNEWSKIVIWGVANKSGEPDFVMCNLPSAGYNSEANAVADALNYANYSIPDEFKGVGFLIGAFTIRISGGTITYNSSVGYQDLRGFFPNTTAGGGGGAGITTYLGLTDVNLASYSGQAGTIPHVNSGESDIIHDTDFRWDGSDLFIGGGINRLNTSTILNSSTLGTPVSFNSIREDYSGGVLKKEVYNGSTYDNILTIDINNANSFIGDYAGASWTSGFNNSVLGSNAFNSATSAEKNTVIGASALANLLSGDENTSIGYNSGLDSTAKSGSVFIGAHAGRHETASNKLFIDNQSRTNEATARTNSLIYGEFNATPSSQLFRVNGTFEHTTGNLGFYGSTPVAQQTVTGAKGGNAALTDLLTKLATLGLIIDSTT